MYGIIRSYKYDKADGPAIAKAWREKFTPIVKAEEGFVEYHWIDTGDGEGGSMSIFDSKEAAEASTFLAGGFLQDHLKDLLKTPPHIIEGEL